MKDDKHSKTNGYGNADCTGTGNGFGMVNLPYPFEYKSEINAGFANGKNEIKLQDVFGNYEVIIYGHGI